MLTNYSDEDIYSLTKKIKKGNTDAFGELVETYEKFVYGTVLFEVKEKSEAKALTEDVFVTAYKEMSSFTRDTSFGKWLYGIIQSTVRDFLKKKYPASENDPTFTLAEDGTVVKKKKEAIRVESSSGVVKLINMLDDGEREALIYRDVMGLTYLEIADITGVAVGLAKTRVTQGREKVKTALEKYLSARSASPSS